MIKKLLFFILLIFTFQSAIAQAPGNGNVISAVSPITLNPGTTVSTGFHQVPVGFTNVVGPANICTAFTLYGTSFDGFYSIDVTIPGDYTFAFANNGTTWKSLTVYSGYPVLNGNCLPLASVETAGSLDGTPRTINLSVGTYYLVVDGWAAVAFYPGLGLTAVAYPAFEILITSPIENDECAGATELFSEVDCAFVTYTNEDATGSVGVPAPSCANYQSTSSGDVWFTYEVTDPSGEFTVTTEAGVMTDSGMTIYSGTCGSLTQLGCNDNFAGSGGMSSLTITGRTLGEIVYIRVWSRGFTPNGTFGICVTVPIPPGDNGVYADCPNERGLELTSDFVCPPGINTSDVVFGNLQGQPLANRLNTSVVNTTFCAFSGDQGRYEEIDFTVPVTGLYVFEMTATTFDGQGYIVETGFTPGVCGSGTFVVGDDDSAPGPGLRPRLTINLTGGVNYTLITTEWSFGGGSGNSPYTWTVTTGNDVNWIGTSPPIEWYTAASGGTPIASGPGFSPVNFTGSGLTDTSVPGVYPFWYACPASPGVRTRVDYVIGKHWRGDTSSDWNTPSNWYGDTVPTDTQCLYIPAGTPNDPIIPDNVNGDGLNLTIQAGASLTLTSDADTSGFGSSLTIQDHITIQGATPSLIVQDGASLIQVNDTAVNTGNIVLSRNADIRRSDYVYWSSPVQGFDVSDVYDVFTPTNRIYEWIPTTFTGYLSMPGNIPIVVGDWNSISSGTMSPGKGYAVRGPINHTVGISMVPATFDGVPNNGVITQAISSGNYSTPTALIYNPYGADDLTATPQDDNWNLIGNPYPSALDADSFLTANAMLEGAVHIWTHGSAIGTWPDSFYDDYAFTYNPADYITYNLMGSTIPFSGKIASGQGFFVLALNDNESGSVTFNNSMRSSAYENTDFYRMSGPNQDVSDTNVIERSRIWLNLADENGTTSNTLVGYIEGATQEKDRLFDAYTREVNSLNIYSKIGNERMTIQGRPLPFDENDKIPLGTVIPQPGEYSIAINNVDGLFLDDNQMIYLEDTYSGTIHDLRANPYTFTETQANDYEDRFILRYTNDALSTDDFELDTLRILAPKGSYIKINSGSSPINTVTVYDLLGRTMINSIALDTTEYVIQNHNLTSGSYIVKVSLSNGQSKTQKVILK